MTWIKKYWFPFFKYAVYIALFFNVIFFFQEEMTAFSHRFSEDFTFFAFIEAFTATIDTAAWVILLFLFELETHILNSNQLKGKLLWFFHILRAICYCFIVYSFWGYLNNYLWTLAFEPIANTSLCDFNGKSFMIDIDNFVGINTTNCNDLNAKEQLYQHSENPIYTNASMLQSSIYLAIIDVLNSAAWILVVIVLEIDVWLQLKNRFTGRVLTISNYLKNFLYFILLLAAIYWGINGEFLDFWDAFLWIIAFAFIEMNLFKWQQETKNIN